MHSAIADLRSDETHDQFVRRASQVFPVERVSHWSRVERAVFNQLMGNLILRRSYGEITDAMLIQCRDDMQEIVRRCSSG